MTLYWRMDRAANHEGALVRLARKTTSACARAVAFCLLALSEAAYAADAFQWTDADGIVQTTQVPPDMGIPFQQIIVVPPMPWNSPPDMPGEIAPGGTLSTRNLSGAAAQSVYWVLPGASVYGYAVAITEELAITNCQVMLAAGDTAMVGAVNLQKTARVRIVAADYATDRCVIKTSDMRLRPVAGVRRFDTLTVGETLYAIGNPRRPDRTLANGELAEIRVFGAQRQLKTTVPIAPASSGVGLFDSHGNLVGIASSYLRGTQIISIAIPAEDFWK